MFKTLPKIKGVETFIVEDVEDAVFNKLVKIMHQSHALTLHEINHNIDIDDYEEPDIKVVYYKESMNRFLVNAKVATISDIMNAVESDERFNNSTIDVEFDNCYLTLNDKWTLFSKDMTYHKIVEMYLKRKGIIR